MFAFGLLLGFLIAGIAFAVVYFDLADTFEREANRLVDEDRIATAVSERVRDDMNKGWDELHKAVLGRKGGV